MKRRVALAADPISREHDTGPSHPERPQRFDAVVEALNGLELSPILPRAANRDEIALAHSRRYIRDAENEILHGFHELSTGDTHVCVRSYEVALHAAGAVLSAVDLVAAGETRLAFCANRPPGHHATPDRGMGFCIFNNVAVAARYAQSKHGIKRVVIADWDVHHGNGTQDIFYGDGSVFFFSTHQYPWYPGTGASDETGYADGEGKTMNCPLPAGSGRAQILGAFQNRLIPAMDEFKPELVILSAGFDSRVGDPLGHFLLTDADFADLTRVMLEIAEKHAGGRLVSVLEGGYSLSGLASAAKSHVEALIG